MNIIISNETTMRQSRKYLCTKAIYSHFNQYSLKYDLTFLSNTINKYFYKIFIPSEFMNEKVNFKSTCNLLSITEDVNVNWDEEIIIQNLPDIQLIKENFQNHFSLYEKKSKNNPNPHTYMKIQDISKDDNITITIEVSYYKHFRPFPNSNDSHVLMKTNEYLFDKVNALQDTLNSIHHDTDMAMIHLNSRIKRLRKQLGYAKFHNIEKQQYYDKRIKQYDERLVLQQTNYQKMIRQYYQELNKKDDCPVCYEKLNGETMYIADCLHYICSDCASKCKNMCPLCRTSLKLSEIENTDDEEYNDYVNELN